MWVAAVVVVGEMVFAKALNVFRAQRAEVEQILARLTQVAELLGAIRSEANVLAKDESLRTLLQEEQTWLQRTHDLIRQAQYFRELETSRFWPAMWRRWVVAVAFALASAVAFGSGYVWASRPDQAELACLRFRVEVLDTVGISNDGRIVAYNYSRSLSTAYLLSGLE